MGQYAQWLHYQEVERRLRAHLETLERELAHLHSDTQAFETPASSEMRDGPAAISLHNTLVRLLAAGLKELSSNGQAGNVPTNGARERIEDIGTGQTASSGSRQTQDDEIISVALMGRGQLPNFTPAAREEGAAAMEQHPIMATPHPEMALLPEDMQAFFDEHTQTDPQQEIPWWLRKIAASDADDLENLRTNALVQRWVERRNQLSPQQTNEASSVKSEEATENE